MTTEEPVHRNRKLDAKRHFVDCQGIYSSTDDGRTCVFIDWDSKRPSTVRKEIILLQNVFHLSDFYVFKTKHGYHGICADKVTPHTLKKILLRTSCCPQFYASAHDTCRVLRFSAKGKSPPPEFVSIMESRFSHYYKSRAMLNFLKLYYKIPVQNWLNADDSQQIKVCKYGTFEGVK